MKKMTQTEANELLFNAIKAKDLDGVKLALDNDAQLEAEDKSVHHATPLLSAVIHGAADIVAYLIARGADVLVKRTFGGRLNSNHTHNLLDYAALDFPIADTTIIDLLRQAGLNFPHVLHDDIVHGNLEAVQQAIAQDEQLLPILGRNGAIAYAAANRQVAVVHYLYQQFTSLFSWKVDRKTRDAICKANSIELIEWYIETVDGGKVANEILFALAQTNHVSVLEHL